MTIGQFRRVWAGLNRGLRVPGLFWPLSEGVLSLQIHQDVDLHAATLFSGAALEHSLRAGRHAWLQVARGKLSANDQLLSAGDGAAFSDESAVSLVAREPAEILLFDLA